ncbi:MAG: hypothetical protein QGF81_04770, partial [Dehalococcoidia bacterium]|nr:hypothetical protein [Dehalococcoidia bacterium]
LNMVLQPERILIASRVVALGYHTSLDVAARPGIQEGKLRVVIEEVYLCRLPLPGAIAGRFSGLLEAGLKQLLPRDLPLGKLRLKVDRGVLTLESDAP